MTPVTLPRANVRGPLVRVGLVVDETNGRKAVPNISAITQTKCDASPEVAGGGGIRAPSAVVLALPVDGTSTHQLVCLWHSFAVRQRCIDVCYSGYIDRR